eukprot:6018115-Pleurochrysis_carterae.AAC.1
MRAYVHVRVPLCVRVHARVRMRAACVRACVRARACACAPVEEPLSTRDDAAHLRLYSRKESSACSKDS